VSLSRLHVACLQLCSSENIDDNFKRIKNILAPYQSGDFHLIVLPENAILLTHNQTLKQAAVEKDSYTKIYERLSLLAKTYKVWLVAGSILVNDPKHPGKFFNHCPVFSPDGELLYHYDKIHLFDADLPTESWQESKHTSPGKQPSCFAIDDSWKIGLSICYDLRFPELYRQYSQQGCNILTVPAAFTVPTGQAHWQTLLKARAIENQSYVLAAAQSGHHQDGRDTYGYSMIIDPWGKTLATLPQGEGIVAATLSLEHLQYIRQQLPALQHRQL
jgi:nitrilase